MRFAGALAALLLGLGSMGCSAEPVPGGANGSAEAQKALMEDVPPGESVPGDAMDDPGRDDRPFRNFALPPDAAQGAGAARHPVLIDNQGSATVVVRASAGAAPVVLDTLAPTEKYRVDLEAPNGTVTIQWRSLDGSSSGSAAVSPVGVTQADSVRIVRIEAEVRSE
jgi:hypothetical protein